MKVALIGGNSRLARGFLDHARRRGAGLELVPIVRRASAGAPEPMLAVDDYTAVDAALLSGFDAAINFVGLVGNHPEGEFVRVNADLAEQLAEAARGAGVKQFIQLSSLSVYGHAPLVDADTPTAPVIAYGRSKLSADQRLAALASPSFTVASLRIPIVYGPGIPSKLQRLAGLLRRIRILPAPKPLPCRSIISQDNLARVIEELLRTGVGGIVFAADPQLFRLDDLVRALPFKARIVPLPRASFAPVRWLAPSLYASLFAPMAIAPECLFRPIASPLIPTLDGLRAAFWHDGGPGS